jgi:hypothetical protein
MKVQGSTTAPREEGLSAFPTVIPEQLNVMEGEPVARRVPSAAAIVTEVIAGHSLPFESIISSTTAEVSGLMSPEKITLERDMGVELNAIPVNKADVSGLSLERLADTGTGPDGLSKPGVKHHRVFAVELTPFKLPVTMFGLSCDRVALPLSPVSVEKSTSRLKSPRKLNKTSPALFVVGSVLPSFTWMSRYVTSCLSQPSVRNIVRQQKINKLMRDFIIYIVFSHKYNEIRICRQIIAL